MKRVLLAVLCGLCVVLALQTTPAQQSSSSVSNSWSNEDYVFYAGDFNGDGYTDILFIARNPGFPSGILLSDGTAPTILGQTWASNYLGIPWSPDAYTVVLGDFNGDGKTDIFLQANGAGDSYLLLTDSNGQITAITQTVPAQAMGLTWTGDQHHLVAGDFGGMGRAGLFFQPTAPGGTSAVVYTDANGQFTSSAPAQTWSDGYLGFNWSVQEANVFAGDFNGDGRADLLIQAQPLGGAGADPTSAYYPPNMNGVVLSAGGTQPFSLNGVQSWSRNAFGVDWSPLTNNLIIGDFNGDGRADALFQPVTEGGSAYLLFGQAAGPIFSTATGVLPADTPISADVATLVAGNFSGGGGTGVLIQATSRGGTNAIAKSIGNGIHAGALALPTLSPSSVSMTGIQYPQTTNTSTNAQVAQPLAGTVSPTSAGRTAGQFSVTPTGAASYNIPLWTPPGARGVEPHLALHYTSGGPDGPMGPGWSLAGLSAIVRCGKTWASTGGTATTTGTPAGVTLSTSDDICIDGNRLRLTSGTQGVAGSTYQTEIADFSLVTAYGSQGNGPQYFFVQGKDGRIYEYGNTADSRIFASGATTPYAWALNKVRDRQGNNMTFTYVSGATSLTLSTILYTATPGTGNAAPYQVQFSYVARTGGTTITKYVAGGAVSLANQLDHVTVTSLQPSSTTVRVYQLGYAASPTTTRPMLQTLQECAGSAGTDCIRPTNITYQAGSAGWSTTATSTGLTGEYGFLSVDLNGDGIPDALYGKVSGSNICWYARIATATGYNAEISTGACTPTAVGSQQLILGNLDGTGKTELLAPVGSTLYSYVYNGSGFTSRTTGAPSGIAQYVADWDGDGLPDLVEYGYGGLTVTVRQNLTAPGGAITFASSTQTVFTATVGQLLLTNPTLPVDFNGDGRADMLVRTFRDTVRGGEIDYAYSVLSNGFSTAPTQISLNTEPNGGSSITSDTVLVGDWNGDGCTDLVTKTTIYISDCTGHFTSFATNIPLLSPAPFPYPFQLLDADGDGQMDLLYPDPTSNTWFVARSTGAGIAAGVGTGIAYASTKSLGSMDRDSDGQPDLYIIDSGNAYAVSYYLHSSASAPPDLANSISDGFGINFSPTYVPISQSNYTLDSPATFPDLQFQGPMYVVNQFSASDGNGGTYTNSFWYYGAHLNLQGRGFEGFYVARQYDSRNAVYQYSYYRQNFPYIGSLLEQETVTAGGTVMSLAENTYTYMTPGSISGASCSNCYLPYVSVSTVYNYEPTGTKAGGSGSYVSYTTTNYTYDTYGNLTDTKATTTDTDSAAPASPFNGQSWITEIQNTITNDNSAANWCLGRPSTTTTTKTVPGQTALTRTVNHTMDYVNCRATVETVEPSDSRLKVTTTFGFDACGNTSSVSVVGLDQNGNAMTARNTTTNYSYSTSRCALPEAVTDALNFTSVTAYNYSYGLPTSVTDPNGIAVSWLYDDFGRKIKETRPDGTYTTSVYTDCVSGSCWGVATLRFLEQDYFYSSAGTQLRSHYRFYDGLDRLRYDEGTRVLGAWDNAVYYYDSLGRKTEYVMPYSSSDNGYHLSTYDVANRLTEDDLYTNAGTLYRSIKIAYLGQTTQVTDPKSNTVTKVTDVSGKIRQVSDPSTAGTVAGTTYYTFDQFGNLAKIVDADNVTSTYTYNVRGFKTASSDADSGAWTFTPDSLNELVSQTDAKSQTTSFGYDLLGRMTSRTEPESTTPTQWTYGTTKTAYNIGRIITVSKPDGYGEGYTYDSAGRAQTVTYIEDGTNYPFTYAYNNEGTVDTLTYPVSTSGYQFVLKYVYDGYGFLNEAKDNAAGTVFWQLNTANDASLPTLETLGNTVQIATSYTPWTNEMITRTEGSGGSTTNLQNLSYSWDLAGNLHQRVDNRQSLTEQFGYDSMNRLLTSTLNGTNNLTLTYDAAGNIASKSDVSASAYVYDTGHPHAVKTAGSWSMTYDANGNMITRAGGAISWYSYNLPNGISYNGNSTQFFYNANHQRWKQVAIYSGITETTHYIGGILEIMTRGSNPTEYRHQIPAGSGAAVYTRRTDGSASTYYATSDHLGSSDLVMDSSANVLTRQSFTPFGARRGSAWTGVPTSSDYTAFGNTTRRGFTQHEMLDSVALVHMNGRVYDPYLGRFLAVDTLVQTLGSTESVNPYAYAWNDPLKYLDPTGHGLLDAIVGIIVGAVALFTLQPELLAALGSFWGPVTAAAISGFVGGFTGALLATGSLSAALTAGLVTGVTAGLTAGIGQAVLAGNWTPLTGVVARVAVGCGSSAASGGNCGQGALSAAFALAATPLVIKFPALGQWSALPEAVEAGLVGGEAAKLAGGKFANGFSTAAVQYLVGPQARSAGVTNQSVSGQLVRDVGYLWSLPDTAIGLVLGGLDSLAGLVVGQVPHFGANGMAIQISNLPVWFGEEGAITFGHVELFSGVDPTWTFTRDVPSPYTGLYGFSMENHEDAHTIQADVTGPFFLPVYLLSALFNGWSTNPFETQADYYAKYGQSALPW
jgi:RHS repeat-associated protein